MALDGTEFVMPVYKTLLDSNDTQQSKATNPEPTEEEVEDFMETWLQNDTAVCKSLEHWFFVAAYFTMMMGS